MQLLICTYCACILYRDLGYVQASDLNIECVHGQPETAKTVPYYTQCYYEAFVRKYILDYLGLKYMQFLPPSDLWKDSAPTWNDTEYRHEVMQVCSDTGIMYHFQCCHYMYMYVHTT